jgi:hypothetical protein
VLITAVDSWGHTQLVLPSRAPVGKVHLDAAQRAFVGALHPLVDAAAAIGEDRSSLVLFHTSVLPSRVHVGEVRLAAKHETLVGALHSTHSRSNWWS